MRNTSHFSGLLVQPLYCFLISLWLVTTLNAQAPTIVTVSPAQNVHTGGPDNFGYRWIDSDTTGGPDFYWVDITSVGTLGPTGDDEAVLVNLPIAFSFYGEAKTNVNISTNGYLTFGSDGTDYTNDSIPDLLVPNDYIAPYWHDIVTGTNDSTIHYYHDVNQDRFIIQYSGVPFYGSGGFSSFQMILYSDGSIVFQYLTMAKTIFLSGNLDARLIPVAQVMASGIALTLATDGSLALASTGLNDLTQTSTPLTAGDVITITGTDPYGNAVWSTFTYGTDGTTLGDLVSAIDVAWGVSATAYLWNGKIFLEEVRAGISATTIHIQTNAGIFIPTFEIVNEGFTGRVSFSTAVYNGLGIEHNLILSFIKTEVANQWSWYAAFAGNETIMDGGSGVIQFSNTGEVLSSEVDGNSDGIVVYPGTGAEGFTVLVDAMGGKGLAGVTQFALDNSLEASFATVGIEAGFGTDGLAVLNNGPHRHDNYAIRFESPVPVGTIGAMSMPTTFKMVQNYPNPFNPVTTIRFDLPQASEAALVVYDISGREVRQLTNAYMAQGQHQVQWDGRGFPAGIYIARLLTPEYSKSIKMVLLK